VRRTPEWFLVGSKLYGEESGDEFGSSLAMSSDGTTIAIGARSNNGNGDRSGHVRAYGFNGTDWSQLGSDIDGEESGDEFGTSLAMSSLGNILAVGARLNDGNGIESGHVRVYGFYESDWIQLGSDIDGDGEYDWFGSNVAMSSVGNTIAINKGLENGYVRVYGFHQNNWIQIGSDIDEEESKDLFGFSIAMSSNGNYLAIGAPFNNGNGEKSGHVRVYAFNGTDWSQVGTDIDGEESEDWSGFSVEMSSDGNTIAIGALYNDGNGKNSGHVRVYRFDGTDWIQVGSDIDGEASEDWFGHSIAMSSDGNTIAIGAAWNDGNGENSGHVCVYRFDGTDWIQVGADINGEKSQALFGYTVAMSSDGDTLAIVEWNIGGVSNSGSVGVYKVHYPS